MSGASEKRIRAAIVGTGAYLPERVLTNAELEKMVETTDEWIVTRTGIRARHIAREDESTSDMAAVAAQRAVESAGIDPMAIGLVLVATCTPDAVIPNTACFVQEKIKAKNAACMDLNAACTGFLFALETARQYIEAGTVDVAMVIGAEKLSIVTDWQDRTTCVLFGDGAGAVVLRRSEDGAGILGGVMGSDGALTGLLQVPGGGSRIPISHAMIDQRLNFIRMTGNEVFKHAVRCMCDASQRAVQKCGLTFDDISWVVPHQANMRIVQAIADRLGDAMPKFIVNLDRVGNMSAASIPVALDEAVRAGRVKAGQKLLFVAFGGGFTWGASVLQWK